MNAYVQEWIWRYSRAKGLAKYVFLAIGRKTQRTKGGDFETGLLPTEAIAEATGLVESTVRKSIKELEGRHGEIDIIKGKRRGESYRFRLRRQMSIPLDASPAQSHRRLAAVSPPLNGADVTAVSRRSDRCDAAVTAPTGGGVSADAPFSSEEVRTEVHHHDDAIALHAWWLASFPQHRDGTPTAVTLGEFLPVALELLRLPLTVEQIQAMSVCMWAVRDVRVHRWIPTTDYGIRVLLKTVEWLGQRVTEMAPKPDVRGHLPPCATNTECIERALREGRQQRAEASA
jgi:hypothetical protein